MNRILSAILEGPFVESLSPERKRIFRRQWLISTVITGLFIIVSFGFVSFHKAGLASDDGRNIVLAFVGVSLLHGLYAFTRKETIWQLRIAQYREVRSGKSSNDADLKAFADKLARGSHGKK
jgi:hypothetical protein